MINQNRYSDWAMQDTLFDFLEFIKTGSDNTIEPNFDERTALMRHGKCFSPSTDAFCKQ